MGRTKQGRKAAEREQYAKELKFEEMLAVSLSPKSVEILRRVAKLGIFGKTPEEVAERFIDSKLRDFVEVEDINLKP